MNRAQIKRLMRGAPAPRIYDHANPLPPREIVERPPVHWRDGSNQADWAGPEMERRNVERLADSLQFQAREALIARVLGYDRPEYDQALLRRQAERASWTSEQWRAHEKAQRDRARRFRSYLK